MLLVFEYNGSYAAASASDNSKDYIEGVISEGIHDDITIESSENELIPEKEYEFTNVEYEDTGICWVTTGIIYFEVLN